MTQCLTTSIYVHLLMMNDTFPMLAIIRITHYVRKLLHCFESWWSPWTWWGGVIFFTWRSYKLTFVRSFVTSFSMDRPISFSWFLAQWCKMVMPKMWRSPISGKNSFPVENARKKIPEKWDLVMFWTFQIHIFVRKNQEKQMMKTRFFRHISGIFGRKNMVF